MRKVEVYVDGVRKVRRSGHDIRRVTLKRLPKGRFVVKVVTTRAGGSKRESVRTYRGCRKSKPTTRRG